MSNAHHEHHKGAALDSVQNPIVAGAHAVEAFAFVELLYASGARVLGEGLNSPVHAPAFPLRKRGQVAPRPRRELDRVRHLLQPELSAHLGVGDSLARLGERLAGGLEVGPVLERFE